MITIIEPHFYWPETTLKMFPFIMEHIERCGRICYKSEDLITDDSAEKFVINICRNRHESVLEHCSVTAIIVCSRACSHQLVRHRIAAYCLAGDTEVVAFSKKGRSPKRWTLKQLHQWSLDPKRKGRLSLIRLRSVNKNGVLVPGQIKSIVESGKQEVYQITTKFGRVIEATVKHRFLTPQGWKQLHQLNVGDKVISNGKVAYKNPEWIQEMYLARNMTRKEVAKLAGISDAYMGQWIQHFGLQKSHSQYPGRKPGHGKPGMFPPASLKCLSESKQGCKNPCWLGEEGSAQAGRGRAQKLYNLPDSCETCGATVRLSRHHCDENTLNNSRSNIMFLCDACHRQWHTGQAVLSVFSDTIISIDYIGIKPTYDIEMIGPNHNFIANGLVVHNSQESQRYCNYGKKDSLQVICPRGIGIKPGDYDIEEYQEDEQSWWSWTANGVELALPKNPKNIHQFGCSLQWLEQIDGAYSEYKAELAEGVKPEDARYVLPNATKTELAVTFNLRQWRHFFRTRCDKHAQWEIRDIATNILTDLKERLPSVFCDLGESNG